MTDPGSVVVALALVFVFQGVAFVTCYAAARALGWWYRLGDPERIYEHHS